MKSVSLNAFDEIHASIPRSFTKQPQKKKLEYRGVAIDSNIDCDDAQILALCHIHKISDE